MITDKNVLLVLSVSLLFFAFFGYSSAIEKKKRERANSEMIRSLIEDCKAKELSKQELIERMKEFDKDLKDKSI